MASNIWLTGSMRPTPPFCLVHAPDPAPAELVHREAHGEIPNAIIPVDLAAVEAFLGRSGLQWQRY